MAEGSVFRPGGISYVRIPAPDPQGAAAFYRDVFGWAVRTDRANPSFEDATGHVIGHFMSDLLVVGEGGVLIYVYVDDVDETLGKVTARGGEIARQPYPEGDLRVAAFRDPPGNIVGLWQRV
jgi:predicted enzyme related to lactoylglutathione lyase